jgi:RimJ/RimL family protein N-acetyltransferase
MTHNRAAIRLCLACGFQIEGLRRACLTVEGREVDEYYFGLLLA